ncbi:MAG: ribbon-helix-helix domain-containing protein [Alphaproteobacteria bacterium]
MSGLRKRSVLISGHQTSVSLEQEFWDELATIAANRSLSINALVGEIDRARDGDSNLSSSLRVHVLEHLRGGQAEDPTPAPPE